MNVAEFIAKLDRLEIRLSAQGEGLRFDAPAGVVTPELRDELVRQKPAILAFLQAAKAAVRSPLPALRPQSRPDQLPLSFAQQRLWFLSQLDPLSPAYNIARAVRIHGALDASALRQALTAISDRHEALRTRFSQVGGTPQQVIDPCAELPISIVDLQSSQTEAIEAEVMRRVRQEALKAFDLHRAVVRVTLLRVSAEDHALLVTLHHIVADGWSVDRFFRELGILYEAFAQERPSPLPPLPIQYADYALWQRTWLRGEVLETQLRYWQQKLAAPTALELPTDRPRPAVMSMRGGHEPVSLAEDLCQALFDLGKQEGATPFMTLLAALSVLFYRYANQEDVLIGTPIASRNRPELEGLIGFFANTLVIRADVSGEPSFLELLGKIRDVTLEAQAHQDVPFEKLVEELDPERDLSRNPLFQVMFAFHNAPQQPIRLPPLRVTPIKTENVTSKFDLLLSLVPDGERLVGTMEYSEDLFDAATICRMIEHFENLLRGIVDDPRERIDRIPLLSADEHHQLAAVWSRGDDEDLDHTNLLDRFSAQVMRQPEALAVCFEQQRLTFGELNARANQLTHYLVQHGVARDVLVGICMERGVEMMVSVLAVLKAGGAYVPLDPKYPSARLDFMLEDTATPILLTQGGLRDRLPASQAHKFCVAEQWSEVEGLSAANPDIQVRPEQLAYVLYTSGSTGEPKGVMMEHGALSNLIAWQLRHTSSSPDATTLQFASLSFDVSFQEIFSTWLGGGTLLLMPEELRRDASGLLGYLDSYGVQRLFLPFVALQNLAEVAVSAGHVPGSLREIITAGEQLQLTPAIIELLERIPSCTLHNQYGPTESHVVTTWTLQGDPEKVPLLPPIGRPISGAQIYILDSELQPTPTGVPGELCIGGEVLSRGYLHRPELTTQKFVPDPFRQSHTAKLYRTGDQARYLPDGNLQFLGRVDEQVKIRGYRVELGEVETGLRGHAAVRDAAARVWQPRPGDERLVGYFVASANDAPQNAELRRFLKQRLPEYMIPSVLVRLDALPLTPSGKLDRRALPEPTGERPLEETYVAPRSATEQALAEIWRTVLQLDRIGVHDNFFESGGHSLLATQIVSRVQDAFATELPLGDLFKTPTIAELAAVIERRICEEINQLSEEEAARLLSTET